MGKLQGRTVTVGMAADLHGHLPEVPKCDVLVLAGDIGPPYRWYHESSELGVFWLQNSLVPWLQRIDCPVVAIAGNHDIIAHDRPGTFESLPWIYLNDSGATVAGLKFWGSPWTPLFGDWQFMDADENLAKRWEKIPSGIDVLVTHGPAYGVGDRDPLGSHAGSRSLATRLLGSPDWIPPAFHCFGHIHASAGYYRHPGSVAVGCLNAAVCSEEYELVHDIAVIPLASR